MPADVIEVDFTRPREPESIEDLAAEVDDALSGILGGLGGVREAYELEVGRWTAESRGNRKTIRVLRRALREELARAFRYSEDDVLQALRDVYAGSPVSASEIATALEGREPTQSVRVRTGHALSRLFAAGLVQRKRSRARTYSAFHWWPTEADDA